MPEGLLDSDEAVKFDATRPQAGGEAQEQKSSNAWIWVLGVLLLAIGL